MADEKTFYSSGGIRITNKRAVFGSKTYSMANISSVNTTEDPPKRSGGIWTAISGIGILILGAIVGFVWLILGGIVVLIIGILFAYLASGTYHVQLSSASGESHAFSSNKKDEILKIVQSLNDAIIDRP